MKMNRRSGLVLLRRFCVTRSMTLKLPNAVSVAVIVGIIALCQGLAETLPVLGQPWVPFVIIALGALVKALQVYLQEKPTNGEIRSAAERKQHGLMRRTLLD